MSEQPAANWRPDGATEAETQDMNKLALSILSCGYLCRVYTDAQRPVFMPLWNYAFNQGGPDPDYVYSTCEIDPAGRTKSRAIAEHPVRRNRPTELRHDEPKVSSRRDRSPPPGTWTTSPSTPTAISG